MGAREGACHSCECRYVPDAEVGDGDASNADEQWCDIAMIHTDKTIATTIILLDEFARVTLDIMLRLEAGNSTVQFV